MSFRIKPNGPDATPANNELRIEEDALSVGIRVSQQLYDSISKMPSASGSHSFEDWAEQQIRALNNVYFPFSRFSFAPDGVLERIRLQRIVVGSGEATDPNLDIEVRLAQAPIDATSLDPGFLKELGGQLTLPDLGAMSVEPSNEPGLPRYAADRFPGFLGGGDTRYEGNLPFQIALPYEPFYSPLIEVNPPEGTGLFAATEVAALNGAVGKRRGFSSDILNQLTPTVLLRALDLNGTPIGGAELTFFQLSGKGMPDTPSFTLVTSPEGAVILPSRDSPGAPGKKSGPFGPLSFEAKNGVFLIRAIVNGETEWGWLKAWQLADSFQRGNTSAAVVDVRFNASAGQLDRTVNLAKDKIVTDSGSSLPAKLVGLVDDNLTTEVELGRKKDDWVEVDLGRDRPIGEVRLFVKSPNFWDQFDVYVYATGQRPNETGPYARELDWKWSIANRRDIDPKTPDVVSIAYRGRIAKARYIRLVNKSDSGPAKLAEIRVAPLKVAP